MLHFETAGTLEFACHVGAILIFSMQARLLKTVKFYLSTLLDSFLVFVVSNLFLSIEMMNLL